MFSIAGRKVVYHSTSENFRAACTQWRDERSAAACTVYPIAGRKYFGTVIRIPSEQSNATVMEASSKRMYITKLNHTVRKPK